MYEKQKYIFVQNTLHLHVLAHSEVNEYAIIQDTLSCRDRMNFTGVKLFPLRILSRRREYSVPSWILFALPADVAAVAAVIHSLYRANTRVSA